MCREGICNTCDIPVDEYAESQQIENLNRIKNLSRENKDLRQELHLKSNRLEEWKEMTRYRGEDRDRFQKLWNESTKEVSRLKKRVKELAQQL